MLVPLSESLQLTAHLPWPVQLTQVRYTGRQHCISIRDKARFCLAIYDWLVDTEQTNHYSLNKATPSVRQLVC